MINPTGDQIGRQGERKFDDLCELAGLIVSSLHPDMTGRDRHVEFPFVEPTAYLSLDTRPSPLACYVQVKTLKDKNTRFKMRLSVAERLARETKPAFICVLRMNDQREFVDMHLLHVYESMLATILKRLRKEHLNGSTHLNQLEISFSIAFGRAVELNPQSLRDVLQAEIADGMHAYAVKKARQLSELGYDEQRIQGKVSFGAVKVPDLVDGLLGLRNLPVKQFDVLERRFGMDVSIAAGSQKEEVRWHTFQIHPTPVSRCTLVSTNNKTGDSASLEGDLYVPAISGLEPEYIKVIVKTTLLTATIARQQICLEATEEFRGMSRSLLKSEQRASLVERLCCPRGIGKIRAG